MLISNCLLLFVISLVYSKSVTYDGNYALSFDGLNDFVSVQPTYEDEQLDDIWTLEAWIYPTATQSFWQLNIVGFAGRHPNLEYCGDNNFQCSKGSPLTQLREANGQYFVVVGDADKLSPDMWHHVCGTWDNVTLSLYVDGKLDATIKPYEKNYTESRGCDGYDCDVGIQIGGYRLRTPNGIFSNQYFRGYIDEVRVWRVGRTQDEIVSTMSTTITGSEPGLQYYWRFDEGKGNTIKSSAQDAYGLLGGGQKEAEPNFIRSTAPIAAGSNDVGERDTIIIEKNSPMAVAAGAMVAVFFMFGGACIGLIVGWKLHEKRIPFKFAWESESLLGSGSGARRDSFDAHMEMRDNRDRERDERDTRENRGMAGLVGSIAGPSTKDKDKGKEKQSDDDNEAESDSLIS